MAWAGESCIEKALNLPPLWASEESSFITEKTLRSHRQSGLRMVYSKKSVHKSLSFDAWSCLIAGALQELSKFLQLMENTEAQTGEKRVRGWCLNKTPRPRLLFLLGTAEIKRWMWEKDSHFFFLFSFQHYLYLLFNYVWSAAREWVAAR